MYYVCFCGGGGYKGCTIFLHHDRRPGDGERAACTGCWPPSDCVGERALRTEDRACGESVRRRRQPREIFFELERSFHYSIAEQSSAIITRIQLGRDSTTGSSTSAHLCQHAAKAWATLLQSHITCSLFHLKKLKFNKSLNSAMRFPPTVKLWLLEYTTFFTVDASVSRLTLPALRSIAA